MTGLFHEYELKLAKLINRLMPAVERLIVDDVIVHHTRPLAPWLIVLIIAGLIGFAAAYLRRFLGEARTMLARTTCHF